MINAAIAIALKFDAVFAVRVSFVSNVRCGVPIASHLVCSSNLLVFNRRTICICDYWNGVDI